jgi:hypothetical protein
VLTAAHAGHAADRLAELVRAAAPKGWDLAEATVSAEHVPAGEPIGLSRALAHPPGGTRWTLCARLPS